MNADQSLREFVERIFDKYDLDKNGFFYEVDETWQPKEIPLVIDKKLEDTLGMTYDQIVNKDWEAAMKWWHRFPFFKYYSHYLSEWEIQSQRNINDSGEIRLINEIFFSDSFVPIEKAPPRYFKNIVQQRLKTQLKQMDETVPGTYHWGADITQLSINTKVFISFPNIKMLLKTFFDIFERTEFLFFRILHDDLTNDEIKEYDFLVSWLGIEDIVCRSILLTYENVKKFKEIYLEDNFSQLTSYAHISYFVDTEPWHCIGFLDDRDLVQKFVSIFPETKSEMRAFSMDVSNFFCKFVWSDAGPYETFYFDDGDEIGCAESEETLRETTVAYVPKTEEEMFGWGKYVTELAEASRPEKLGGLYIPKPEVVWTQEEKKQRRQQLWTILRGGNLYG